ncbi:hypothetical protein K437DRAFT_266620 [Tilletiaria anomala UBC 951]|uniref:Uncharacterized protein n=1 Tax=Tilletiaria anomala (strain ATCC 24038 / CBS 436.72 / UBC 951) TaxID=1037660 RepID=A0A066WIR5_TILAU|nr:uncharacterized protein K437DRAFT_266620 [Tilletiaria anomala UBC 951]KDN52433.1 hypothetical protein K437DRAFT_266620 [Tilletiaria anomala UBC 951]
MSTSTSQQIDDAASRADEKRQELQRDAENAAHRAEKKANEIGDEIKKGAKNFEKAASRAALDAKKEATQFWSTFSSNPEYWASTLASVNLVLLGAGAVYAYTKRDEIRHTDRGTIAATVAGIAALLGVQTYAANEAAKAQNSGF